MLEQVDQDEQKIPRELLKFNHWEDIYGDNLKMSKLEDEENSEPFD